MLQPWFRESEVWALGKHCSFPASHSFSKQGCVAPSGFSPTAQQAGGRVMVLQPFFAPTVLQVPSSCPTSRRVNLCRQPESEQGRSNFHCMRDRLPVLRGPENGHLLPEEEPRFAYPVAIHRTLRCLCLSGFVKNAAADRGVPLPVCVPAFHFFGRK
nr:uncharacterized protein LOC105497576 isoform X2 [Macaca nemestrina]